MLEKTSVYWTLLVSFVTITLAEILGQSRRNVNQSGFQKLNFFSGLLPVGHVVW